MMNAQSYIKLFFFALMMFFTTAYAGSIEMLQRTESPQNGDVVSISDLDDFNSTVQSFKVALIYGRQQLTDVTYENVNNDWTFTVKCDIKLYAGATVVYQELNKELEIDYSEGGGKYIDLALVEGFSGVTEATVTVVDNPDVVGSPPVDIQLELTAILENYSTNFSASTEFDAKEITESNTPVKLDLFWNYIENAEEYEVEWVFINDNFEVYADATHLNTAITSPEEAFDLSQFNVEPVTPVNVITPNQHYTIDLTYPKGELYYRIRAISKEQASDGSFYTAKGDWIYGLTLPSYPILEGFENMRLWNTQKTYAEEGKHKEVITYYDEHARPVQTITNLNTENSVLAGQSFYDFEGRPTITVLPAPIAQTSLGYNVGLNNIAYPGGGTGYFTPEYMVQDLEGSDADFPVKLDINQGTSNYYSDLNQFEITNSVNMDLIPDAKGLPYTQVIYKNDNTGRIVAQSGIGEDHIIGSGHETKYYYAKPTETELHRLFGPNVGKASHYKKTLVKDPNGQFSVSYMDQEGRTIATALAGSSPENLDELDYNDEETLTVSFNGNNVDDEQGLQFESQNVIVNDVQKTYSFKYNMSNSIANGENCFNCTYELNIFILDQHGEKVTLANCNDPSVVSVDNDEIIEIIDPGCVSASLAFPVSGDLTFDAVLDEGEYSIVKNLRVITQFEYDESMIPYLEEHYGLPNLDDWIDNLVIDYSPCDVVTSMDDPIWSTVDYDPYEIIEQAEANECASKLLNMVNQIKPGGYYYEKDITDDTTLLHAELYSVNNNVTAAEFYDDQTFDEDWIIDCLPAHPEYCHYQVCVTLADNLINNYEMLMRMESNWTTAATNDYDDPLNAPHQDPLMTGSLSYTNPNPPSIDDIPFTSFSINYAFNTALTSAFNNYEIELQNSTTPLATGVSLAAFYDPYVNHTGEPSISMPTPNGSTVINPMYAGIDPLDIDAQRLQFFANAYGVMRMKVITEMMLDPSTPTCLFLDNSVTHEDEINFFDPLDGIAGTDQDDVLAMGTDLCEGDAQIMADQWIDFLNDYEVIDLSSTDPSIISEIEDLRDDLHAYLVNQYCSAVAPELDIFPWPVEVSVEQIQSFTCTSPPNLPVIVPELGNLFNSYSIELGLSATDLQPQLSTSFATDFLETVTINTVTYDKLIDAADVPLTSSETHFLHYTRLIDRVGYWMGIIEENCADLALAGTPQALEDLEIIELLLTRYALDNYHIFNPSLTLNTEAFNKCYNTGTLGDIMGILGTYACMEGFPELPEISNNCPTINECGFDVIDFFNNQVFDETGGACNPVPHDGYLPLCGDDGWTVADDQHYSYLTSACDLYLVDECGDAITWMRGLVLYDEFGTDYEGESFSPNNYTGTLYYSGIGAYITYPSCYGSHCEGTDLSMLTPTPLSTQISNPPLKVYFAVNSFNCTGDMDMDMVDDCEEIYDDDSDCIDFVLQASIQNVTDQWNSLLEEALSNYLQDVTTQCFANNPTENFTATYDQSEYHYTLYYYDQSGNLIQTIPPEGVEPLVTNSPYNFDLYGNYIGGSPNHRLATQYNYNSLNQVVWQSTPDGGETKFEYNEIGQLRYSQNAQQAFDLMNPLYSYTKYDELGRITEVGESDGALPVTPVDLNDNSYPGGSIARTDITSTYYDGTFAHSSFGESNYRNRVTTTMRYDDKDEQEDAEQLGPEVIVNSLNNINVSYYEYDVLGNVQSLIQQIENFESKVISYEYDLVSGNVNKVSYQPNEADAFHHRYEYDADNRITNVYTSRDNVIWEEDAQYFYYPHGPLARVELGNDNIQGLDYYYTLHGWLKGINTPVTSSEFNNESLTALKLSSTQKDGVVSNGGDVNDNKYSGKDEFVSILGYYDGDYEGIGSGQLNSALGNNWPTTDPNHLYGLGTSTDVKGLFNGNIKTMYTDINRLWTHDANTGKRLKEAPTDNLYSTPRLSIYYYDQLNRITASNNNFLKIGCENYYGTSNNSYLPFASNVNPTFTYCGMTTNGYTNNNFGGSAYHTSYAYDKNGNLTDLVRHGSEDYISATGGIQSKFDEFTYNYELDNNSELLSNKLQYIDDAVSETDLLGVDIEDQPMNNYAYDEIGNLIRDSTEGIDTILWDTYGKIREVTKNLCINDPNCTTYMVDFKYVYDAMGNRIAKIIPEADGGVKYTYYVRDASGNVMATYEKKELNENVLPNEINYTLYGSSRLGTFRIETADLYETTVNYGLSNSVENKDVYVDRLVFDQKPEGIISLGDYVLYNNELHVVTEVHYVNNIGYSNVDLASVSSTNTATSWEKGRKNYELANHLGNVNVVVSDRRVGVDETILAGSIDFDMDAGDGSAINANSTLTPGAGQLAVSGPDGAGIEWLNQTITPGLYESTVTFDLGTSPAFYVQVDILDVDNGNAVLYTQDVTTAGISSHTFSFTASSEILPKFTIVDPINSSSTFTFYLDEVITYKMIDGIADHYLADVVSATDYYPFGMEMPGRTFTSESYRYGFNGMEKDGEEISGSGGNQLDFGARIYDSRLGRWLSTDPLQAAYSFVSPYQFVNNNPIRWIDPDGKQWINPYLRFLASEANLEKVTIEEVIRIAELAKQVDDIINTLKSNDLELYDYIENAKSNEYDLLVSVYLSDAAMEEFASTNLGWNKLEDGTKVIVGGEFEAGFSGDDVLPGEKKGINFINIVLYTNNVSKDDPIDNTLANEAGDVMFLENINAAWEDALEQQAGVEYEYLNSTHYSFNVEKVYDAKKNGEIDTNDAYPLQHQDGTTKSTTNDGKYKVNHYKGDNAVKEVE